MSAQTNSNPEKRIDSLFSSYNSKTAGVAVGIVKDGELIFKKDMVWLTWNMIFRTNTNTILL